MWYSGSGMQWWGWGLGVFTTVIFWGLIIWVIVALAGWARGGRPGGRPEDDANRILDRRFAAGEIDADEYHRRLDVLRERHAPASGDQG